MMWKISLSIDNTPEAWVHLRFIEGETRFPQVVTTMGTSSFKMGDRFRLAKELGFAAVHGNNDGRNPYEWSTWLSQQGKKPLFI